MSVTFFKSTKQLKEQAEGEFADASESPSDATHEDVKPTATTSDTGGGSGGGSSSNGATEADITDGDHTLHLCREMILVYAEKYLRGLSAWFIFLLVVSGGVDFAAMFHVLSNKYLDAFGNPTTGGVTLAFAAGMTLMWFMFIGILLKVTKIGAFMVWVLLVLFLGVTLWPSEVSSLQSLWGSTQAQIGGFGATSTEAIVTAPLWFLSLGISILAVGYTLPGLVFIYAKSRIARMNELWRLRSEACAVIAQADAVDAECEAGRVNDSIASHFDDPTILDSASTECVLDALQTYEKMVSTQVNAAKARLNALNAMSNQERSKEKTVIHSGEKILHQLSTLSI